MAKVAFIINSLEGGGAEKSVLTLAEGMIRAGVKVHLVLLKNIIEYATDSSLIIHPLGGKKYITSFKLLRNWIYKRRLLRLIDEQTKDGHPFDLIVSSLSDADRVVSKAGLPGPYFCIRNNLSAKIEKRSILRRIIRRREVKRIYGGKNLITISRGIAEDLTEKVRVQPSSLQVIYNAFDFEKIRMLASFKDADIPGGKYIINVGRFSPQKRHDLLLDAFRGVDQDYKLVILGKGKTRYEQELRMLVSEYGLDARVILAGFRENPYPWINHAELLVLSSDYEGFGRVIVESLVLGTPVVSTDCPHGPGEILQGELTRCLVPVGDSESLRNRINEVLREKIPIPSELVEPFHIDHIVKQYLSLAGDH